MRKHDYQNLSYLLISTVCALVLSIVLTKSSPDFAVAALGVFVTVLCVQIAFLRRELCDLRNQISGDKSS